MAKPIMDIFLFSKKLSEIVGWRGPIFIGIWYMVAGLLIKMLSPPFGKLTSILQKLEGDYRKCHTDII